MSNPRPHTSMQFNTRNGALLFARTSTVEGDVPMTLASATFTPGDPDIGTPHADVDYDPAATCPSWNMFLLSVQPDEKVQKFLQVFTAYALLIGGNPEQKLAFHYGRGANGKSVFFETIAGLAGGYATRAAADMFSYAPGRHARPDLVRLIDKRLVLIEEMPGDGMLREDLVKSLTAGLPIVARRLHQAEPIEFHPIFKAMLSGSSMPRIEGTELGIWRRLFFIPWMTTVPADYRAPIGTLLAMFEGERPGILNWLIDGIKLYLEQGFDVLTPPYTHALDEAVQPTEELRLTRNNVSDFVDDFLINEPGATIQAGELYLDYVNWCERTGLAPVWQVSFGNALKQLGIKRIRGKFYSYGDVARKPADEPDAALDFLLEVRAEVDRARAKFPGDNLTTIALFEEAGEIAKAVLQESPEKLRKEAIQLACMAVRIALDGDTSTTGYRARLGLPPLVEAQS